MKQKGQMVEILSSSSVYRKDKILSLPNEADLLSESQKKQYSLFDGVLVGEHQGLGDFKLGQRKGINLGGKKKPMYVIGIDTQENRLFVGEGADHPGLFIKVLAIDKTEIEGNEQVLSIASNTLLEVQPEFEENTIPAQLLPSEDYLFLKLERPIRIDIMNNNISVFYKNTMIFNIK